MNLWSILSTHVEVWKGPGPRTVLADRELVNEFQFVGVSESEYNP